MFRFVLRFMYRPLLLLAATILLVACNNDKKEAAATAKVFLQAYYVDLDFETALRVSSNDSRNAIIEQEQIMKLNPYAKNETPNIIFKNMEMDPDNPHIANCVYICNQVERKLPLRKLNGRWLVSLQGGTVTVGGTGTDFIELSSDKNNGFASAASGNIKYKKRRPRNPIN